jgi:hypothetical protein
LANFNINLNKYSPNTSTEPPARTSLSNVLSETFSGHRCLIEYQSAQISTLSTYGKAETLLRPTPEACVPIRVFVR